MRNDKIIRSLRQFEGRPGVTVALRGEALEVTLLRSDIEVRVVVPKDALEWFVDVEHRASQSRAKDWCDYEGYDDAPRFELENEMAADVTNFLAQAIERDLRYVQDSRDPARGILEWLVDGGWRQAIPFVDSDA
jgi:hypothetical protein